jgi:hypothetical protein
MVDENSSHQEMSGEEIEDRSELERVLALLKPSASSIDRDSFLFLAGRASVEPVRPGGAFGQWMWPAATLLSSVAAVVLAVLLVTRPQPAAAPVDLETAKTAPVALSPSVVVQEPSLVGESSAESSPALLDRDVAMAPPSRDEAARDLELGTNYPRLRSYVLAYGIDALPVPAPIRAQAPDSIWDDQPRTRRELLRSFLQDRAAVKTSTHSAG